MVRTLIDLARHHFGPEGQAAQHHSEDGRAADDSSGVLQHKSDRTARPESLESWARFHEAAGQLPEQDRQVFDLVWYAGMEQREVATLLGISVPTVKRRWRNARLALYDHHGKIVGAKWVRVDDQPNVLGKANAAVKRKD